MTPQDLKLKRYLGDGVYAGYDGSQIWVWTSNGFRTTNMIALEAEVLRAIGGYLKDLKTHLNNGDPIMEEI